MNNENDDAQIGGFEATETSKNIVYLPSDVAADAQDGETVSVSVEGTIETKEDGSRCLNITSVDGKPLESKQEEGAELSDEEIDLGIQEFAKKNSGLKGYK